MSSEEENCKILQLSDCVMMYILSYLDATSLFTLSRTCTYFNNLIMDPQLWRYIDARREPNSTKKVDYVCERVHEKTTHILLRAESKYNGLLSQDVFDYWYHLEHLTILALENQRFNGRTLKLQNFPSALVELSLKRTYIKNGKHFFERSYRTMENLKVLILDECEWLSSNFLMSVAKYQNLEILSIVKCRRLHLNIVPYLNVARFGFEKLKLFDCRFSTVGNEILIHSHKALVALYLQSMSSYELDTGLCLVKCPILTHESQDLISQSTIKDHSLEQYRYMVSNKIVDLPSSELYEDPYPKCSCGWKDRSNNEPVQADIEMHANRTMPVDDFIDFNLSPQRFICRKHGKELNKLPNDFKNYFYENQKKFYPGSSGSESESDTERECCMFGVGKSQMIVLKLREVDEQGNIPEPEVINIFGPDEGDETSNVNVDVNPSTSRQNQRESEPDSQPSTSRSSPGQSSGSHAKRKADDDIGGDDKRKLTSSTNSDRRSAVMVTVEKRRGSASNAPGPSWQIEHLAEQNAGSSDTGRGSSPQLQPEPLLHRSPLESSRARVFNRLVHSNHKSDEIRLRRLSLRGYREITDEALNCIRNIHLDLLDVTYTRVSKEGIERYLMLNPNCRVLHPNYCVCKPIIPC